MSALRRRLLMQCMMDSKHVADATINDYRISADTGLIVSQCGQMVRIFYASSGTYSIHFETLQLFRIGQSVQLLSKGQSVSEHATGINQQQVTVTILDNYNYLYVWLRDVADINAVWITKA